MGKKFYLSKTLWFNVLTLVLLIAQGFGFAEFEAYPGLAGLAAGIVALANVVLRVITREPVVV